MNTCPQGAPARDEVEISVIAGRLRGLSEICCALWLGYAAGVQAPGLDPARMFHAISEDLRDLAEQLDPEEAAA